MKKILSATLVCALALVGCQKADSLLDTENYQAYDTSNYPKTEVDATQVITGIYNVLADFYKTPTATNIYNNSIASDEMLGGSSTSGTGPQSTDRFMEEGADSSQDNFKRSYKGIFRCNYALESIPEIDDALFSSIDAKNYLLG